MDKKDLKNFPNFYAPRTGEEKLDAREYMRGWEQAKLAMKCPHPKEARRILNLSIKQFAQLLDISERQVSYLECNMRQITFAQRILINKAIEVAHKKGYLKGDDDYDAR